MIREYCDRCGADITESKPLKDMGSRFIANRRPKRKKWYALFRKRKGNYDRTYDICEKCLNELWDWWEKGANKNEQ